MSKVTRARRYRPLSLIPRITQLLKQRSPLTAVEITQELNATLAGTTRALMALVEEGVLARCAVQFSPRQRVTFLYWIRSEQETPLIGPDMFPPAVKILRFLQETGKARNDQLMALLGGVIRTAAHFWATDLRRFGLVDAQKCLVSNPETLLLSSQLLYSWCPRWFEDAAVSKDSNVTIAKTPQGRRSLISPELLRVLHNGPMSTRELKQQAGILLKDQMLEERAPEDLIPNYVGAAERMGLVESFWMERSPAPELGYRLAKVLRQ